MRKKSVKGLLAWNLPNPKPYPHRLSLYLSTQATSLTPSPQTPDALLSCPLLHNAISYFTNNKREDPVAKAIRKARNVVVTSAGLYKELVLSAASLWTQRR